MPKSFLWLLISVSALIAEVHSNGNQDLSLVQHRTEKWALSGSSSSHRLFKRASKSPAKSSSGGSPPRPTSPQPVQEAQTSNLPPQTGKSPGHSPQGSPGPAPIRPSVVRLSSGSITPSDKDASFPRGAPPIPAGNPSHPLNRHPSGSAAKEFGAFKPVTSGHGGTDSKFTISNRSRLRQRKPKRKPSHGDSDDEITPKGLVRILQKRPAGQAAGQPGDPPNQGRIKPPPTSERREKKRLWQLNHRRKVIAETGSRRTEAERKTDNLRNEQKRAARKGSRESDDSQNADQAGPSQRAKKKKKSAARKDPWESDDLQESNQATAGQGASSRQRDMMQERAQQRKGRKGNAKNAWDVPDYSSSPSISD